jgi:hypothetical protein
MMEAARTSETMVNFYQTTWHYNPEDSHLHTHRCENLTSNPTTNFSSMKHPFVTQEAPYLLTFKMSPFLLLLQQQTFTYNKRHPGKNIISDNNITKEMNKISLTQTKIHHTNYISCILFNLKYFNNIITKWYEPMEMSLLL